MLLCCEDRCLDLIEIGQRLEDHEIGTRLLTRDNHLAKELIGILERERPKRLDELPDGTDIERDAHTHNPRVLRCTPRSRDVRGDHLRHGLARSCKLVPVRTERIAVDHTAARRNVVSVNLLNHLGMFHPEEFGALARRKSARLQLRAHASV